MYAHTHRFDLSSLDRPHPLCYIPRNHFQFLRSDQVPSFATGKFLPNRMAFFFRQALEETVGRTAVDWIWRNAGPQNTCLPPVTDDLEKSVDFSCFSALCASIGKAYGESGSPAILHRCGRAALIGTMASTAALVDLDGPRLYARSGSERILEGLGAITRLLGLISDMECRMEVLSQEYRFHIADCPECFGRQSTGAVCHSVSGMLRGALDWFSINPAIPVTEVECLACGGAGCVFSIAGIF
jgi:predicted hydrocarbon binding protein